MVSGRPASEPSRPSGRQLDAALAATGSEDGATRAGVHPQPETMGLRTAAVIRLEGALAHGYLSTVRNCWNDD